MAPEQGGFSLMEALISLLVLSVGLLGLARLQAQLWRASGTLYATADAYLLSEDLLERARGQTEAMPAPENQRLQSVFGRSVFTSILRVETRDRISVMEIASGWEDPASSHQLQLRSAAYRPEPGDSRWLLETE